MLREIFDFLAERMRHAVLVILNPRLYIYHGISVPLRATPELQKSRRSIYDGEYERAEIEAIRALIRPDDVVLELGTGCGIVASFIASQLADSRNLHTFEANPHLFDSIRAVAAANGFKFHATKGAVGAQAGEAEFYFDSNFLSSSLYNRHRISTPTKVEVLAMADLIASIRPTFIVFDIEGAEAEVMTGPIAREVRVLCGELHPPIIGNDGVSAVIQNILSQGFNLLVDQSQGRVLAFSRPETSGLSEVKLASEADNSDQRGSAADGIRASANVVRI